MSNEEVIKVTTDQLNAFNAKNWEEWCNTSSENCIYDEIATHRKLEGRDNVLEAMKGWANAFPNVKGTFGNIAVDGNKSTVEITWKGTHTGILKTPDGDIPATGKEITIRACQIAKVENGKITTMQNYFDMMTMMTQLGLTN